MAVNTFQDNFKKPHLSGTQKQMILDILSNSFVTP